VAEGKRVSLEKAYLGRFLGKSKFWNGRGLILSSLKRGEKSRLHGGVLDENIFEI